jgi:hypothetical protein
MCPGCGTSSGHPRRSLWHHCQARPRCSRFQSSSQVLVSGRHSVALAPSVSFTIVFLSTGKHGCRGQNAAVGDTWTEAGRSPTGCPAPRMGRPAHVASPATQASWNICNQKPGRLTSFCNLHRLWCDRQLATVSLPVTTFFQVQGLETTAIWTRPPLGQMAPSVLRTLCLPVKLTGPCGPVFFWRNHLRNRWPSSDCRGHRRKACSGPAECNGTSSCLELWAPQQGRRLHFHGG